MALPIYASPMQKIWYYTFRVICALVFFFLVFPIMVIIPLSFNAQDFFTFTPEIVGGTKGVFISNRIAYHISSSLNWGLGAALGAILLVVVLALYWLYDKFVGIDNVKLG